MSQTTLDIATHKSKASSQSSRMLRALKEDFIHLDERSIADLIESTNALSAHLNFYSESNVVLGTWDSFFKWEVTSILAQISKLDVTTYLYELKTKKRELLFIKTLKDQKELIQTFFNESKEIVEGLIKKVEELPDDLEIKTYFLGTQKNLSAMIDLILEELDESSDVNYTLQHHLFNKKVQGFFGLLDQWRAKSEEKLAETLESYSGHSPQYALYLAFLKLFGVAQTNLNEFTKRHLDFYYKNILKLTHEKAQPDSVHLCIEPHKDEPTFLLEKGSIFPAGKDTEGNKRYYEATSDTAINQAKVTSIYGSSIHEGKYHFQELTELNASGESWKAFPGNSLTDEIGFIISSPVLYLRGGDRSINIAFTNSLKNRVKIPVEAFDFYLTGEEEWLSVSPDYIEDTNQLNITLDANASSIVPFHVDIHMGVDIQSPFPALKIIAKNGLLTSVNFSNIEIHVDVKNYQHFKLFSQTGEVDHSKPFEAFGFIPRNGNALFFSCKEFFQKPGAEATVFEPKTDSSTNSIQSLARLEVIQNGAWNEVESWKTDEKLEFVNSDPISYDFSEDEAFTPDKTNGFAKLVLDSSSYAQSRYMERFIDQARAQPITNLINSPVASSDDFTIKQLNFTSQSTSLPYVPVVSEVNFSYSASASLSANNEDDHRLYHLYPRGYQRLKSSSLTILPELSNDGELFIGISQLEGGNSLNLLFKVLEGSANPRQNPIQLQWNYLNGDTWKEFGKSEFGDDTNGLTQSGIVKLNSPKDLLLESQTIFPSTHWWIKIIASERVDAICDLVGVHDQALLAKLTDFEETGSTFLENIAAKTITKQQRANKQIKKIIQPYDSFGGKPAEDDDRFYLQTSERLRHKSKAITQWDYERLILDHFPGVFKVKCLNHHRYDSVDISNLSAGYVTIIPVAKSSTLDIPGFWKPLVDLGTMKKIEEFLSKKTTPHARINVKAPKLEKLELAFNVKYLEIPGADTQLYSQELQDTINTFLSPWAYNQNAEVEFEEELEKSRLIHLLEKQSFVDYITEFKVNHLILDDSSDIVIQRMNDVERIIPKTVYSLFIPNEHQITTLTVECCE